MINDRFGIFDVIRSQKIWNVVLSDIRAREQILLPFMLFEIVEQIRRSSNSNEKLPFSDHNVFLEVMRRLFRNTKVLHIGRHFHLQFLTDVEEVIDGVSTGEYNGRMLKDVNLLLPKIPNAYWSHFNKGSKVDF